MYTHTVYTHTYIYIYIVMHVFINTISVLTDSEKWQPTQVFLTGESHGQRSLGDYSPWGRKGSDTAEAAEHADSDCLKCIFL